MTCQLGAGGMPIPGQNLSSWAGTRGWIARNTEVRSDDMLIPEFLFVGGDIFPANPAGREGGQTGFPSLCRGEQEFKPNSYLYCYFAK